MIIRYLSKVPKHNLFWAPHNLSHFSSSHSCKDSCSSQPPELNNGPEPFETLRKDEFTRLYSPNYERISGHATKEGTKKYSTRKQVGEKHFRSPYRDELSLSSIGIGTYVGAPDEIDDLKMFNGIIESVESGGVNVLDTAINYRYQKSERVIGAALKYLLSKGYSREELFICSKNGYVPEDADKGVSSQMLINSLVEQGKIKEDDVVGACHCLHPNFLEQQLESSLSNIGVDTLDILYLHNTAEMQIPLIGYEKYKERLAEAFQLCEQKVSQGKIRAYGLATWMCFRAPPEEEKIYFRLQEAANIARSVGGEKHNLKYIQLPVNMIMAEAFGNPWQEFKEDGEVLTENVFQVARRLNINVITSSPLAQGQIAKAEPPVDIFKMSTPSAKHIQFTRSIPAQALLTTLVGQKTRHHVLNNLEVIKHSPLPMEEWVKFFEPPSEEQK